MSRSGYDPRKVLRETDNLVLKEFFGREGILGDVDFENRKETEVEDIFEKLLKLEPLAWKKIDSVFRRVYELACENGIIRLIEEAKDFGLKLNEELEELRGKYNKAFRVFMEHPNVFESAEVTQFLYSLQGWKQKDGLPKEPPNLNEKNIRMLESELRDYFVDKEGRGNRCKVEHHNKGDRTYICAYPENYSMLEISYDKDSQLDRTYRKPVIEIYFLYNDTEGSLSVKTRGGYQKKDDLLRIFIKSILGPEYLPPERTRKVFELNRFAKKGEINFNTPMEDGRVIVDLKLIRITYHSNSKKRRVILEGEDQEEIYKMIEKFKLPVDESEITKVKLHVEFERVDRNKSVTFELTYPDSCTLGDSDYDLKIRQYLKDWGIHVVKTVEDDS